MLRRDDDDKVETMYSKNEQQNEHNGGQFYSVRSTTSSEGEASYGKLTSPRYRDGEVKKWEGIGTKEHRSKGAIGVYAYEKEGKVINLIMINEDGPTTKTDQHLSYQVSNFPL